MLKLLFLLFSFAFSQQIMADSLNLIINGTAVHQEKKDFNEKNWGVGFEYNFEEVDKWTNFINGGFFKDSYYNNSNYLGGGSKRRFLLTDDIKGWHIDAGITAFIMTRKNYKNNQAFIGVLPYLSIGTDKFAINATYIPSISPKFVSLWFFQASFKVAQW